jgi:molecular chaperone GrpE
MTDDEAADAGSGASNDVIVRAEQLEGELRAAKRAAAARERQLLLGMVGVLDGFRRLDRAIGTETLGDEARRVSERFGLLRKRLESLLEREGVTRINSLGLATNPELHEVFDEREDPAAETGTIVDVDEEGYLHRGAVLRRAKVTVAKG